MIKKIVTIGMLFGLSLSLVGCGSDRKQEASFEENLSGKESVSESSTSEDANRDESGATVESDSEIDTMPETEGETLYVYSWNDEFEDRLQLFMQQYPEYKDRIMYVNLDVGANSGDYKVTLETLLQGHYEESQQYPSIIVLDESIALDYLQTDYTLSMSELGIEDAD